MYKNCLNEETLTNYLEDSLQVTARAVAEEHLISCDACRSRLVYYMRILDEDIHEEEEPVVAAAMERWDPGRIPVSSRTSASWTAASPLRKAGLAASVLVAVTLGAMFGLWNQRGFGGEELIEQTLREVRPFQFRTSVQEESRDWVEYTATRDASGPSVANRFALDAMADDAEQDSVGNHIRGLGYLVQGDWDRAVTYLEAAKEEQPDNPRVLNDLGVAYFERSKRNEEETSQDYALTKKSFDDAAGFDSAFEPPRFNLVLLYKTWGMDAEADVQSQLYVEMDPDSRWAVEVMDMVGED